MDRAELLFVPLGGVGEIGMNCALYGIGGRGVPVSWILVDCGMTFAEGAALPGIDVIFPDMGPLPDLAGKLLALILTHGHEDHIGAVLDLWPRLRCPVYATPFTAALLAAKAQDEPGVERIPTKIIPKAGRIEVGPFDISFLPVSHSIPESHALALRTPAGRVLHTGDWKLDPAPVLGDVTDLEVFGAFGAEGVDALIGDSTNAVRPGRSPSESEVATCLRALVAEAPQRVALTLFASNIARVQSIAEAAEAAGREVILIGRALERNVRVARATGYLRHLRSFLGLDAFQSLPPERVCAVMTGSQGEERSALARVARRDHPAVSLARGDRVIFSSRIIPGNERPVIDMLNGLVRQGVEVITDATHLVHVSGHPRTDEMRALYEAVRPRAVIPVHGEAIHLDAHARLARSWGVPETVQVLNGAVVRLAPGPVEVVDHVASGRLLKDGKLLLPEAKTDTVAQRRRLAWAGVVSVAVVLSARGAVVGDIDVQATGLPDVPLEGGSLRQHLANAALAAVEGASRARRQDRRALEDMIARAVRSAAEEAWGKKPVCHISVSVVPG